MQIWLGSLLIFLSTATSYGLELVGVNSFEDYLNSTKSLHAEFVQRTPAQGLELTGSLYFEQLSEGKSQLVWLYADGSRLRKLADGRVFWENQHGTLTQLPARHPLLSLFRGSNIDLAAGDLPYSVNEIGIYENQAQLALVPKDSQNTTEIIELLFDLSQNQLKQIQTYDQLGQLTVVQLTEVTRNQLSYSQIFDFIPPEERNL